MAKYKVFMTDCIFPDTAIEEKVLKEIDAELVLSSAKDTATYIKEGKDCDALLNVFALVPNEFLDEAKNCKIIVRTGIGVNTIDLEHAAKKGICVANVPDYCLDEVADHTFALFLSLVRKTALLDKQVKSGVWNSNNAKPIPRLAGKVYGVLGFGNIAQRVAKRAQAFGMEVWATDPYVPAEVFAEAGVKSFANFDEFIKGVDFLSVHVPLIEETKYIINLETMKKMKNTALIFNTARGPLINETDLLYALQKGIIGGAGLDVREQEPPEFPNELSKLDNVVLTPHAAFVSEDANVELRIKSAQEVVRTLIEGKPKFWVNKKLMQK